MGFFVQCNCKSEEFFFIVLMFCEAEAVNICREGSNCKKKKNTLNEFKIYMPILALVNGAFKLSPGCDVTRVQYSINI